MIIAEESQASPNAASAKNSRRAGRELLKLSSAAF
jgi:hypothetical protein